MKSEHSLDPGHLGYGLAQFIGVWWREGDCVRDALVSRDHRDAEAKAAQAKAAEAQAAAAKALFGIR